MMSKDAKSKYEKLQENARDRAASVFGDLDFLDELPDPPERVKVPFPYGKEEPKPYGWHYK